MVSQKSIKNCFWQARFYSSSESEELSEDIDENLPLTELADNLQNWGSAIPDNNLYVKIYQDLVTNSKALI